MGLDYTFYKLHDANGGEHSIIVPKWDGIVSTTSGTKTITQYLAAYPDFPFEATWFTATDAQKAVMETVGFLNVVSIDSIIQSGLTKWYFDDTKYLEFYSQSSTIRRIRAQPGNYTISSGIYTTAPSASGSDIRALSMTSNVGLNATDTSTYYWFINSPVAPDKIYMYGAFSKPTSGSLPVSFWQNIPPFIPPTDPYSQGGTSKGGEGGNGTFDGSSTPVDIPALPSLGAIDAGFITLFNPSLSQLNALAAYMWDPVSFDVDTWSKLFADPMDAILGLNIVPVSPPTGGSAAVKVGNISTNISMPKVSNQYVELDCGTLEVKEYWGAYLDYSPYTKCELFLPYIGVRPIDIDDVMKKNVTIKYHVDVLSGACVAYVKCGDTVLYSFIGQCSSAIPTSGRDYTNMVNGALTIAGSIGSMIAGTGNPIQHAVSGASAAVNMVKPNIEKSGAMSGTGGLMGVQKPYFIFTRPKQALPERQNTYTGYPSFVTSTLSDCEGYTEISEIHLQNMSCTGDEAAEIETLLRAGVII